MTLCVALVFLLTVITLDNVVAQSLSAIACNSSTFPAVINAGEGWISSPSYPSTYNNIMDCRWLIRSTRTNMVLTIQFEDFFTVRHYDFVYIYNGNSTSAPVIARMSGWPVAAAKFNITTTTNTMFLRFTADSIFTYRGFNATYWTTSPTNGTCLDACSAGNRPFLSTGNSGSVTSPNYLINFCYSSICEWLIAAPLPNQIVRLHFNEIDIDNSGYFRLYDGQNTSARRLVDLHGYYSLNGQVYVSTQRYIYVSLTTTYISLRRGFNVSYYALSASDFPSECTPRRPLTLSNDSGVITTPNYPANYPNSMQCEWLLKATQKDKAVSLLFAECDMYNPGDNVNVYDGMNTTAPLLVTINGYYQATNVQCFSTGPAMYITFSSDFFWMSRGFTATYSTSATINTTTSTPITTRSTSPTASLSTSAQPAAPPVTSVTLEGPIVIQRLWIEFYCVIHTPVTNSSARFSVQFQFNGQNYANVPPFTATTSELRVTLHERFLAGKLQTNLRCVVQSYWTATPSLLSSPSFSSSYYLSLAPSISRLTVTENELLPQFVHLQSTLPMTCHDAASASSPTPCSLGIDIQTANDIAVSQAGFDTPSPCKYLLTEGMTRQGMYYVNTSQSLAVIAKSDPYVTYTRNSRLIFSFPNLPLKTAGGYTYPSIWSQYILSDQPWIYRYDSSRGAVTCTATADVHYTTFDGLFYSSYGSGPFIYSRSTAGQAFELQARQGSCSGPYVKSEITCVCGVAMREGDAILILDACQDGLTRAVGYNHESLSNDSGIFADASGRSFKIQMPSGNKVYIDAWGYIMNLRLVIVGRPQIQGMCGSPDGNKSNDLIIQGTNTTRSPEAGGWAGPQGPVDVVDSWRPARGQSLFEGYLVSLPTGGVVSQGTAVPHPSTYPLCSYSSYLNYPSEPDHPVKVLSPSHSNPSGQGRRRRRSVEPGLDEDDQYDPSLFTYEPATSLLQVTWPTRTGITEEQANDTCWSMIVNVAHLGPSCMSLLKNSTSDAQDAVSKCVLDVQLTDSYDWARDKIAELQKSCYFSAISQNNSAAGNDTQSAIALADSAVQQVTAFACVPFDCNGHGICSNGTCICSSDYVGADCKVSSSAIPVAHSLLTPTDCDARYRPCNMANVNATDAASIPTLSCKTVVTLKNGSTQTYIERGVISLAPTVTCSLPTAPLNAITASFNFTSARSPSLNFYCLASGSPVLNYSISVSNDGVHFSNALPMRVLDSLCMDCSGTTCSQLSQTCLINGYCFNSGDVNPYDSTQTCKPSVSSTLWTDQKGVAVSLKGTCEPTNCPVGTKSVQASDATYSCVSTSFAIRSKSSVGHLLFLTLMLLAWILAREMQ